MSHFTHMRTHFQNLFYLKKTLNKLNIEFKEQNLIDVKSKNKNLIIPQSNGYDIQFSWNNNEYDLIVDVSFWEQSYPIQTFIDKVSQQYANEVIMGEGQKIGFQYLKSKSNVDGSNTLILERWNNNK